MHLAKPKINPPTPPPPKKRIEEFLSVQMTRQDVGQKLPEWASTFLKNINMGNYEQNY